MAGDDGSQDIAGPPVSNDMRCFGERARRCRDRRGPIDAIVGWNWGCRAQIAMVADGKTGTLTDPITVQSYGEEQYLGCTGVPVDSHVTIWLTVSKDRPIERCPECGSVYKMDYVGPDTDAHAHDDHGHGDHGDHGREFAPNPGLHA